MNSYAEFRNHPDCLTSYRHVLVYVAKFINATQNHAVPYYYVSNLGTMSDLKEAYFNGYNMKPYLWVTMPSPHNPDYKSMANGFDDPRLKPFAQMRDNDDLYITSEDAAQIIGIPDGYWNAEAYSEFTNITKSYFLLGFTTDMNLRQSQEKLHLESLSDGRSFGLVGHLVFSTKETAEAYLAWAKQDPVSIQRNIEHQAMCDELDEALDSFRDDRDDLRDDDD